MTTQNSSPGSQQRPTGEPQNFNLALAQRYRWDRVFEIASWAAVMMGIVILVVLLIDVVIDGFPRLDWTLLSQYPSRKPQEAGLLSAWVGTIYIMVLTAIITFPLGVGTGIYLEEFAANTWYAKVIEININNLAAVPSIIYGLLGVAVFARVLEPITGGRSILTGALTLSLLILPIVIVATRESLRAVPNSLRQAGFALGATRWQVIWEQILPLAFPGILTGTILALSRAIGETAPLITIGALTFIAFLPEGLDSPFTVLPIQIFNWISRPQEEFHTAAAAGIIVLMVVLLSMNATAIWLRNRFQK
ncbi:MAG: phosphate ABC transporter permease PstA [Symploca sp. SIO1B1]|nr:phosphate ABC transporter permease PstA [Symploca sp. SIO1A3]NER94081.1 phosphate ABC transporter permease PstA [Symploca sp. SIO1B1]